MTESMLTTRQAAEHVNRTPRTLRNWRNRGDLIGHPRANGSILYSRDDLERAVQIQVERFTTRSVGGRPQNT